jgi:hypothetical protein
LSYQQYYNYFVGPTPHYHNYTNCLNTNCDFTYWSYLGTYITNLLECWNVFPTCGDGDTIGAYCSYWSDEGLKTGIKTLKDALPKLLELEAVEYDWNQNLGADKYDYFKRRGKLHTIGLIAQDVRKYYPEVVGMHEDGYYFVEYHKLNAVLVEAIKSQQIFIEDIKDELNLLETLIN